jgi:hypothetical protein
MSDNNLVPCGLGQLCVRETVYEDNYVPVQVMPKRTYKNIWFDIRPEFKGNCYVLDVQENPNDPLMVMIDKQTFDFYYAMPVIKQQFAWGELMFRKWVPTNKYCAVVQKVWLVEYYYWLYRVEVIPAEDKVKEVKIIKANKEVKIIKADKETDKKAK